jgi:hypothetical protein
MLSSADVPLGFHVNTGHVFNKPAIQACFVGYAGLAFEPGSMGTKERHPKIQSTILRCLIRDWQGFRLYLKSFSLFSSLLEKQAAYSSLLLFLHYPGDFHEDLL